MDRYEYRRVSFCNKRKGIATFKVSDGNESYYVEFNVGKVSDSDCTIIALNAFGEEGWSLCVFYTHTNYTFIMQRRIQEQD